MTRYSVKDFYDNEGWEFSNSNSHDAVINENLSEVASTYVSKVRLRIKENLGFGENLLDIGCGPIQYKEYAEYSEMFKLRICVDLSKKALKVAEQRIGLKGKYIVGDYLSLPPLDFVCPFSQFSSRPAVPRVSEGRERHRDVQVLGARGDTTLTGGPGGRRERDHKLDRRRGVKRASAASAAASAPTTRHLPRGPLEVLADVELEPVVPRGRPGGWRGPLKKAKK